MTQTLLSRRLLWSLACLMGLSLPAAAQMTPSLNLSGNTGLIDMPSGEMQPDGFLGLSYSNFGPITRTTLTFQIAPRLSGSFRYVGIQDWNAKKCPPDCKGANAFETYYDRNFDLRYQLLDESQYLPAVTIGLQDFIGTGLDMAEYVAATKGFGGRLKVTAGLGWGRLGSYGALGSPLGDRPKIDFGKGGTVNYAQWFRGPVAPFAGLEYKLSDKWTLKAEYSSDNYTTEAKRRGTFERKTPFNFGAEYQATNAVRLSAYSMYGSEVGFSINVLLNPAQRPAGGMGGSGPLPVKVRPSRAADPAAYGTGWLTQADAKSLLIDNLNNNLVRTGLSAESLSVTGDTAQVRFRNTRYDASAQAIGRVARAMTAVLPSSVEVFQIVPLAYGMTTSQVTLRRSDVEALEFTPDAGTVLRPRVQISAAGDHLPDGAFNTKLYPEFSWSLGPYFQTMLFNPAKPFQIIGGLRLQGKYEPAPGIVLSGSINKHIFGNIEAGGKGSTGGLPPVRSAASRYYNKSDLAIESLTAAYYTKLAPEVYGRVTAGYLEQMYGGVSAEVLWKPDGKRWALGAEVDYVAQRDSNGRFGFDEFDYRTTTGFISGYYDFGNGYSAQVDVGRYLAGDKGATLTLMRNFDNGWKIGAFATLTNISADDFGEGSFDKGIRLEVPLAWFAGQPTRTNKPLVLRPLGRDGGAQLFVNDRLVETLRGYNSAGIDAQWGRFWK
jgi:hypothetical protein